MKKKLVWKLLCLKKFERKIVDSKYSMMWGDGKPRRQVEEVTLECGHGFWREKTETDKTMICEACLNVILINTFGCERGCRMFWYWENRIKRMVR